MITAGTPYAKVNEDVVRTLTRTGAGYYWALAGALALSLGGFLLPWILQLRQGLWLAGMNQPNMWGTYLANFIFWIGLSHSGTLLSAILHITHSPWRRTIYRSAEAMTLFSLITAALFVLVHLGRPWFVHWALPYPNQMELWPNFRSPLLFDVTAIFTYMIASATFLYVGAIPDFAAVRDRVGGWRKPFYTLLSLGWRGSDGEWQRLGRAYTFFAVLIIPLAVSVHSIVSWDFAMAIVPGFHQTLFAPYFVVGAIYSGSAGIVTLMYLLRRQLALEDYITIRHFDHLGKLLLALSLAWSYINLLELFTGWYGGSPFELESLRYKLTGPYGWLYWSMWLCCGAAPLLLILARVRHSFGGMLLLSLLINFGMYSERFLIVATGLARQYLPASWDTYVPSGYEIAILFGSLGNFVVLFLLFVKLVPSVSIYEVKGNLPLPRRQPEPSHKHGAP